MKRVTCYASAGHTPVTHFFFNRSAGQGLVPALSPPGGLTPVRADIFSLGSCPAPIKVLAVCSGSAGLLCCPSGVYPAEQRGSLRAQQLKKKTPAHYRKTPAFRFIWIPRTSRRMTKESGLTHTSSPPDLFGWSRIKLTVTLSREAGGRENVKKQTPPLLPGLSAPAWRDACA